MKHLLNILLFVIMKIHFAFALSIDPDESRSLEELVASRGFELKEYRAVTEDGYILTVHRVVPEGFGGERFYSRDRKPVIAFHGAMCQSSVFLVNSPHLRSNDSQCGDNFAFGLVQTGRYDIWLPNARGNGFSDRHTHLLPSDPSFWKFTLEEIGLYDLPAVIKLVQRETSHRSMGFVGYSQGGAVGLVLLSMKPHYASVLKPFITWAPAVYMGHMSSIMHTASQMMKRKLERSPGRFLLTSAWFNALSQRFCRPEVGVTHICKPIYDLIFGASESMNLTRLPVYGRFFPSPSSNWQAAHYAQLIQNGRFSRFQFPDPETNYVLYGQATAPDYPLERIPKNYTVVIMHGRTDAVVEREDSRHLVKVLKAGGVHVIEEEVKKSAWSHLDFVVGRGAGRLLYDPTLRYLDRFM